MEKQLNSEIDTPDERDIKADKINENHMKDEVDPTRRTIEEAVYKALDTGLDIRFINQCVMDSFVVYAENHPNDSTVKAMRDYIDETDLGKNNVMEVNSVSHPIKEDQSIKDFIGNLGDPNFMVQKQDYMELVEYVSIVEKKYDSILIELNDLKAQLGEIHNKNNTLTEELERKKENVFELGSKLNSVKDLIITFTQNALASVKEKGFVALNKVVGFFKVKEGLQSLNDSLIKMAHGADRKVQKINAVSHEYHEMGNRAANIGRLLIGKEAVETVRENGKLSGILQRPFSELNKYTLEMSETVNKAIEKIEKLEDYTVDNMKSAQGNNVFVLSEQGYRHRAAKGLNDIKPGQSFPEYKNKVPKSWAEKGWVKEVSQDALQEIQKNQSARVEITNNRQPIIELEP